MDLEKIKLFNSIREFFLFLALVCFVLAYSLLIEYSNYKHFTQFDSCVVEVQVLKQYVKKKKTREYQVLKLKLPSAGTYYTTFSKSFQNVLHHKLLVEIYHTDTISFFEYLNSFYRYSKVLHIYKNDTLKQKLNTFLQHTHKDENTTAIYQALYSATPLPRELQLYFSNLGISHLFAISGFHLSILSGVLFFLFKFPYRFLQQRFFPYRSYHRDSFFVIFILLFSYLAFLEYPPSLLRALSMFGIGFLLYDRGYKVFTMQTLFVSVMLLLAFLPRLFFQVGFWLSVAGVFYIFLFLILFRGLSFWKTVFLLPFWIYGAMLPFSLALFGNFSFLHPLSIVWSFIFNFFYPLSIVVHLAGFGNLLDSLVQWFLSFEVLTQKVVFPMWWLELYVAFSFFVVGWKWYKEN